MEHLRHLKALKIRRVLISKGYIGRRFKSDGDDGPNIAKKKLLSLLSDMAVGNRKSDSLSRTQKVSIPIEKSFKEEEIKMISEDVEDEFSNNVKMSVEALASKVTGDTLQVKSELAKRLQLHSQSQDKKKHDSIRKLFEGMNIEKHEHEDSSSSYKPQDSPKFKQSRMPTAKESVAVFLSGSPLNIFTSSEGRKQDEIQQGLDKFWLKLQESELKLQSNFSPNNAFEEMIQWTEQGKHWKFPIDNEDGNIIEENTPFSEHVFLDQYLKDFPNIGPIRRFMELVILGMSRNPFIPAQRKRDNIKWYLDYFKEKESILKEFEISEENL